MSAEDELSPEQRAALDDNERALREGGAENWQEIFESHLEMRQRFVYVTTDAAVVDLSDPLKSYTWKNFCLKTAGSTRTEIGPRGGERKVLVAKDWLDDAERLSVETRTFAPNDQRLTTNMFGLSAVNLWSPPAIAALDLPQDWAERAAVFAAHMHYLVPDKQEADSCLLWLAHLVQRPEQLPGWHVLMIAENVFGVGRNWVSHAMARMLPRTTVEDLPLKRLLDGKHNQEIQTATLGVVDEIREGGHAQWAQAEALKSFLTAKSRTINPKHAAPFVVKNYLRLMFFSNHSDALPIPEKDRRLFVARCNTVPKDKAYYDSIYAALDDPGTLRAIYESLSRMDLTDFDIEGRAPDSAAKLDVIAASTSVEEAALRKIVTDWVPDLITAVKLRELLQAARDEDRGKTSMGQDDPINTGQLRCLYKTCGVKKIGRMRVKIPGESEESYTSVLALRNAARWSAEPNGETQWRKEIDRKSNVVALTTPAEKVG